MKRALHALLVGLIMLGAAGCAQPEKTQPKPPAGSATPPQACHIYKEHRKDVDEKPHIPVLDDKKAPVYKVLEVIDGDTIAVEKDGQRVRVRFMAIDTPEKSSTRYGYPEAYGEEAYQYAKKLIEQSDMQVRLTYDVEKKDKYDRDLAYVWLKDGRMLNALMVADGYAYSYTSSPKPKYVDLFLVLMREARAKEKGLWAACK